ncbi:MAG: hypothetical protein HY234_11465 [Acidobacteria bacterium]|nr:hypothetical protein [Acidobacteriota bacterium]MBI3663651.1 hypothetical protein [Acidobacteriota bacterium]
MNTVFLASARFQRTIWSSILALVLSIVAGLAHAVPTPAPDFHRAPSEELMRIYGQIRQLHAGDQWADTENVAWKRDAGTFRFEKGRLIFAAPVDGRILAAAFIGQGTFEMDPPSAIERRQIARFSKGPKLVDSFRQAVFFFTDDSWGELQKLVRVQSGGDQQARGNIIESAQKKYAESFNDWWANQRKGNFPMRNLAARMLADLSDPSSRGLFLADLNTENYDNLLFHISWNRETLLLSGISNDEEVMLVHAKRNEYWEWWAGFHLAEEYAQTSHPEHRSLVAHCQQERIEAEISKDNHLSATVEMDVEVPGGPVRLLSLNLEGVLRIASVSDAAGNKLAFIQEARELDSDPWIILPEPTVPGRAYKLQIVYQEDATRDSRIIHQQGSGLYYVTARESWFPSFGAFDDRTRYTLRFRSPKKFSLLGTGHLAKSDKGKETLETEWESEIPLGVVGFNYGDFVNNSQSDSNLTVTAYSGKEVPDELRGLEAAIATAELAQGTGHQSNLGERLGIQSGGFNTARMVGYAATISYQALRLHQDYFGPLPFKAISVTEQPVIGYGQSWPTLIFLPYDSLLDASTRHGLRLQVTPEAAEFYNLVAVHEMAHQWWGHVVGWKTYHDQWLSEGFAEFSAGLYLRKFEPKKWSEFWELKKKYILSNNRMGQRPVDVGPLWLNYQLNAQVAPNNSQVLIYDKGAYVLEMLRAMMEDPNAPNPDQHFIAMMRDFASTYAGKNASTEDFRRIVEKHMGEPMGWFFEEWVYGTEVPHYDFMYQLKDVGGGKTQVQMTITQSGVSEAFVMRVPVYVTVNGRSMRLGLMSVQGSRKVTDIVTLPVRPERVTLDDNHSILCTIRR